MQEVFSEIDRRFPGAVEELAEICRFPSTRQNEDGTLACARWLRDRFEHAGLEARLLSVEGSNPLVYAWRAGASKRRLLFFNHYDVERSGDPGAWSSAPFEPEVRDSRLYGRGTADNKGSLIARVQAVEALLRVRGELPCEVSFAVEAKRDIFAPHFEQIVSGHAELFRADACIWENALNGWDGRPTLRLGDKGMCMLEVRVRGDPRLPMSSMYAALFPGAGWELVHLLSALRPDPDRVPEWLSAGIVPLTKAEMALCLDLPLEGGDHLLDGFDREQATRLRAEPTLNLGSLRAGIAPSHDAPLSAVPAEGVAYLDLRLLPGQETEQIIGAVREQVRRVNARVEVTVLGQLRPHRTPVEHSFVDLVKHAAQQVWGADPRLEPLSTASGSRDAVARVADTGSPADASRPPGHAMPIVGTGIAYPDSRIGRPDENVRLDDFRNGMKFIASILCHSGEAK